MHFVFLTALYLVFAEPAFADISPPSVMLVIASLALYGASAVLVNDYFDIASDKASGKERAIYYLYRRYVLLLFILLTFLGFASLIATGDLSSILLYWVTYTLALLYSVPPFRFKARGYMSLAVDVLIEKPLPVLLLFVYFKHFEIDTLVFVLLALAIHSTVQVRHQLEDFEADVKTGVRTFVVEVGYERARSLLYTYLFPISAVLNILVLLLIALAVPYLILMPVLAVIGYAVMKRLIALRLYSQDRSRIPEWHRKEDVPMPSYYSYTFMWVTSACPVLMGVLAAAETVGWLPLLIVIIASQYYYLHLHYVPLMRATLSALRRLLGPSLRGANP